MILGSDPLRQDCEQLYGRLEGVDALPSERDHDLAEIASFVRRMQAEALTDAEVKTLKRLFFAVPERPEGWTSGDVRLWIRKQARASQLSEGGTP